MEGFRSPTRTFKLRGGEGVVHEGREREISTPFTTSSAGGLGLMEAPPAPRKKSFSPSTALRSREIRLKGLGDSGDSVTSDIDIAVSPVQTSRHALQARSLNFDMDARDDDVSEAPRDMPRVKDLAKVFGKVQLDTADKVLGRGKECSSSLLATPRNETATSRTGSSGSQGQRKRLYNQISQPPATPVIDFKEQKTESAWLN